MKKSNQKKVKATKREGKISEALSIDARQQAAVTCKILEYKEMQGVEAEIAGDLTNKYCYQYESKTEKEFDGTPKVIRGIRAVGAREAIRFTQAKLYNFIPKFTYEKEDLGDGWYREVVCCTNPKTKEKTRSTCQFRRGDRFGDRTASTIAERNAMLKQLPEELKLLFINYCVEKGYIMTVNVDPALVENKAAVTTLADGNAAQNEAGKEITAAIARIYAVVGQMGVDKAKIRAWLHRSYKTPSLKNLDVATLAKIGRGLSDIYCNEVGRCAKPKMNVRICSEFTKEINALILDEKGEIKK